MHTQLIIQNIRKRLFAILICTIGIVFIGSPISSENLTNNKKDIPKMQLSWPVKIPKKYNISSTFGESRHDHFHNGLDIGGNNLKVFPMSKSVLFLKKSKKNTLGKIPFGGGNTIILKHLKKNSYSGYMHLSSFSPEVEQASVPITIEENTSIGRSGNSGHSGSAHLHFFVTNSDMSILYNPLFFLNNDHYKDKLSPQEIRYYVHVEKTKKVPIDVHSTITLSDNFPFSLKLYDRGINKERWGVYKLKVYHKLHKTSILEYTFDVLNLQHGNWYTSNNQTFRQIYLDDLYYLGNQFKTQQYLSWEASGFSGPKTVKQYKLQIIDK